MRSVRDECLAKVITLSEHHLRELLREYVAHYHGERIIKDSRRSSSNPERRLDCDRSGRTAQATGRSTQLLSAGGCMIDRSTLRGGLAGDLNIMDRPAIQSARG